MKHDYILGVDIGGSHLTAVLVSQQTQTFRSDSYIRIRIDSHGSADEIITTWCNAIASIFEKYEISDRRMGIAMPGPFNYEKGISLIKELDKYDSLYGLNIKNILAERLHMSPNSILMMNDAAGFLRGEMYSGCGKGFRDAIGVTLGTGTGTAIHHGVTTTDANLGPSSFMESITDNYFSTRWFVKRYAQLTGIVVKDVKELSALHGVDSDASLVFTEFVSNFSLFLSNFIMKESPEVVILGGNIMHCSDLFLKNLEQKLKSMQIPTPIIKAQLGEKAAILGAANLFAHNTVMS